MSNDFETCEKAARKHDPDRFFAALFAPADRRPHLFALTALYFELAHAVAVPREPLLKDIRLVWWREMIEAAHGGTARDHAVARALVQTFSTFDLPLVLFETIILARMGEREGFVDIAAAEAHADATVGSLMRAWALVLGGEGDVRDAAVAYGLAGRTHAGIDTAMPVQAHFAAVRQQRYSRALLPAIMPAALVPLYQRRAAPPLWRKQMVYFGAALRGRI